jgi:hypothetical protein
MKEFLIYSIHNISRKFNVLWIFLFTGGNKDIDLYKTKNYNFKVDILSLLIKVLRLLIAFILGYVISKILITHFPKTLDGLKLNTDSRLFLFVILLGVILTVLIGIIKVIRYQYRISRIQLELFILISTIYWIFRCDGQHFLLFSGTHELLDYFLMGFSIFFFGSLLNYGWPKFNKADNYFFEDNPLRKGSSEIEKKMIDKLKLSVIKDKYELSFSIGIIGPWGLGKSSFLNQLKSEILEEIDRYPFYDEKLITYTPQKNVIGSQEIIFFEFSPFLNHNEDTVIHDFFTQLNNHLNKRSGKLSNAIQDYSEKLIKLVDKNKIYQFAIGSNSSEKSVNELYDEVIEILNELELKFIIFIDDMDRLNPKEILQVLKLIRNTSNFPNFVFVVALDKEYVVNALRSSGDFANKNYIDKFFQLECFLPEIESNNIIDTAIRLINEKGVILDDRDGSELKTKLIDSITNNLPLFIEYVQNFRDVKRFLNQLHFEYNNISNLLKEVSIEDYINLMLLKSRFPEFFRHLAINYENFFNIKNGIIQLKPNEEKSDKSANQMLNSLSFIQSKKYYRPDLSKYEFDSILECESRKKYTCFESDLIKRTIVEIFNDDLGSSPSPFSVRRVSNFRKILYWRISNNDLSSHNYETIIEYYKTLNNSNPNNRSLNNILNILKERKLSEFVLKLSFEFPENEKTIKAIILIAFDILRINDKNDFNSHTIYELLDIFYNSKDTNGNKKMSFSFMDVEVLKDLLIENFINVIEIDILDKINLLNHVITNSIFTGYWHFSINEILLLQLQLIHTETKKYNALDWLPNDYKIFQCYYLVRENLEKEGLLDALNENIKTFFKNKKLNVLFFNLLNPEVWSHSTFRLNQIVDLVFKNTANFIEFIEENYKSQLIQFPQISEFLILNNIVQNTFDLKYDFDETILVGHFDGWGKPSEIDRENTKNAFQLFFETDLSPLGYTFEIITPRHSHFLYNSNGKTYFLFVSNLNHTNKESFIDLILDCFQNNILNRHGINTKKEVDLTQNIAKLIDIENPEKNSFKLISNK